LKKCFHGSSIPDEEILRAWCGCHAIPRAGESHHFVEQVQSGWSKHHPQPASLLQLGLVVGQSHMLLTWFGLDKPEVRQVADRQIGVQVTERYHVGGLIGIVARVRQICRRIVNPCAG